MISRLQIVTQLVEKVGGATSFFHRLINDIIDSLNGQVGSSGVSSLSPNGSGIATVTHGFAVPGHPPTIGLSSVQPTGTTAFVVQIQSLTTTTLTVKLFDMAGSALTSGTYDVAWKVAG
jgi:hypothetical protein